MPAAEQPPQENVWDATYPAYYQLADVLQSVAESHSGVPVDSGTVQRWRELMGIMREIDTHVDDTPSVSHTAVIDELTSFGNFRQRYPHITPEVMGQEMHDRLIGRTMHTLRLGRYVSTAETPYRYFRLRMAEATQTADIFADSASDEVRGHPNFEGSFMPLLRSLGIAACMLDSAHDLPNDHQQGKARLAPTFAFRARMLAASVRHVGPHLGICLRPRIVKQLLLASRIRSNRQRYST